MLAYENPGQVLRDKRKQIKQALQQARRPGVLLALQRELLQTLGDDQREVLRRADYQLPCKAGCGTCCHLRVEPYAHEILLLLEAVLGIDDPARRQAVEQRLRANAARIGTMTEDEHYQTNIACAFLENGSCSVHERRPLTCARYHSTDLAACLRAYEDPIEHGDKRPVIPEVDLEGDVVIQAMRDALKQAKRDHRRYEMSTTLVRLLDDPDLVQRWQQGKPLLPTSGS
jgi:Fe-S-cluster containining protein